MVGDPLATSKSWVRHWKFFFTIFPKMFTEPTTILSTTILFSYFKARYKILRSIFSKMSWLGNCMSFLSNISQSFYRDSPFNWWKFMILSHNYSILDGGKDRSKNVTISLSSEVLTHLEEIEATIPPHPLNKIWRGATIWTLTICMQYQRGHKLLQCSTNAYWGPQGLAPQRFTLFESYATWHS